MLLENGHEGADTGLEPIFFPEACVVEVLTDEVVEWVLGCNCRCCEADAKYAAHSLDNPTKYIEVIMSKIQKFLKLFAVLIYIDHPALIIGFINLGAHDKSMEDRHSTELERMDKYWPNLHKREPREGMEQVGLPEAEANSIVQAFLKARHQFFPPKIDSNAFVAFDGDRILPFINHTQLKKPKGNYGTVYSFQFYPGYFALEGFLSVVGVFLACESKASK